MDKLKVNLGQTNWVNVQDELRETKDKQRGQFMVNQGLTKRKLTLG